LRYEEPQWFKEDEGSYGKKIVIDTNVLLWKCRGETPCLSDLGLVFLFQINVFFLTNGTLVFFVALLPECLVLYWRIYSLIAALSSFVKGSLLIIKSTPFGSLMCPIF